MSFNELEEMRQKLDDINDELLHLINKRGQVIQQIGDYKQKQSMHRFDPVRERDMLNHIIRHNQGPYEDASIEHIFKEIFKASLELLENNHQEALLVSRQRQPEDTMVKIKDVFIGNGHMQYIMGPCSIESYEQTDTVARAVKNKGVKLLRGGAFKPRTSPYDFQGLGIKGLKILKQVADKHDLATVSEIVSPNNYEAALDYVDVIQIGARNMQNFELLKAAGNVQKPILLKRGLAATISEFLNAAEYIMSQGNSNIILCERGIRTYETATRNTLDITAVPVLKKETHLPVMVDVTHSTGRRDLLLPAAKAALAIGADGIMAEVHPDPSVALSDSSQQMDLAGFDAFMDAMKDFSRRLS